jgi:hypothetical protein
VLDIDAFAGLLLEEAKRFLEIAAPATDQVTKDAYLHAALLVGFCALEAHVNSICAEFSTRPELSTHEKAFLLEQEVRLEKGVFKAAGLKMTKLEDRITFLHARFSRKPLDTSAPWWAALGTATHMRNKLTHPKGAHKLNVNDVKSAVTAIVETIDALYRAVYKKKFPAANRGLTSRLTF